MARTANKKASLKSAKEKLKAEKKAAQLLDPVYLAQRAEKAAARAARPVREKKKKLPADQDPLRTHKPVTPLINRSMHAKWGALLKKHMGVLETHVKMVDRVCQLVRSEMELLGEEEKREWELDVNGPWRTTVGVLDRARGALSGARQVAGRILPPRFLVDKKGLGLKGLEFEAQEPLLAARAKAEGYVDKENRPEPLGADEDIVMADAKDSSDTDSNSNSDSDSGSDSEDESIEEPAAKFTPLEIVSKSKEVVIEQKEENSYFVVDTEPTPVTLTTSSKAKKEKKPKKSKKPEATVAEEVDFKQVELQVAAELESARIEKEKEEERVEQEKKDKKKRKRESTGESGKEVVIKKSKSRDAEAVETEPAEEGEAIRTKKEKKRKSEEVGAGDDKKKRRKEKSV